MDMDTDTAVAVVAVVVVVIDLAWWYCRCPVVWCGCPCLFCISWELPSHLCFSSWQSCVLRVGVPF